VVADAGVVEVEVDLPDFDAVLDRLADLGLDGGVVPAWLDLEAGVVVQEADQQDRALLGGEAVAELADVADEPVGGVKRRAWPGLDVGAEGDLEIVERGLDLDRWRAGPDRRGPGALPVRSAAIGMEGRQRMKRDDSGDARHQPAAQFDCQPD